MDVRTKTGGRSSATPGSQSSPLQDGLRRDSLVTCAVNFEKGAADFGQPLLGPRKVFVQSVFEDITNGGEIEVVTQPAGKPFRFIGVMSFG